MDETFVLLHGSWHGGWAWEPTAWCLRELGHTVYTPTYPGHWPGVSRAGITHDDYVRAVTDFIERRDLRDVILVGHSYGGMVITGVADRAADRVGRLVFLDAANPRHGQSLVDVAGPVINAVRPMGETIDGIELVLLPAPDAGLLYGVTDPDDLAWMAERLTAHPWKCFEQPLALTNEDALDIIRESWAPQDGPVHLRPIVDGSNVSNSVALRIQYALTYQPGNLTITDGALASGYNQVTLVDPNAL